jgi:hypothetical protein
MKPIKTSCHKSSIGKQGHVPQVALIMLITPTTGHIVCQYFTEFGAALTTVLPVLLKYCYKYCYSDSRKL